MRLHTRAVRTPTAHEGCTDADCTRGLYGLRLHTRAVRSLTAHEGCTVTDCTRGLYGHRLHTRAVRTPSALEVDSRSNISCRIGDSNPRQYCTSLFRMTFCLTELFSFHPRSLYIKNYFRKLPVNDLQKNCPMFIVKDSK